VQGDRLTEPDPNVSRTFFVAATAASLSMSLLEASDANANGIEVKTSAKSPVSSSTGV